MSRSARVLAGTVFSAIVMLLFANLPSAQAGADCQSKLIGNTYNCTYTDNESNTSTECITFSTGGTSRYFDAVYDGTYDLGCACDASGSLGSAKFDASSDTFECSYTGGPELVTGKVKGKKLTNQGIEADGYQFIEQCTLTSESCP